MTWHEQAACADSTGAWFRSLDHEGQRHVCATCPVAQACLTDALADPGLYVAAHTPGEMDLRAGYTSVELWEMYSGRTKNRSGRGTSAVARRAAVTAADAGRPLSVVSERYGIPESTLREWVDNAPECLVDGCVRHAHTAGMCCAHYKNRRKAVSA